MEPKHRFFIYDRKEMIVLSLLGVFVALFAFTLGIHLGKRLIPAHSGSGSAVEAVSGAPDAIPGRQELVDASKDLQEQVDDSLSRSLHEEVVKTGIKLDQPRAVKLPENAKTTEAGATQAVGDAVSMTGAYALQIGSFPSLDEARDRIRALEQKGLKPSLKIADLEGKGVWYRVVLSGFASKDAAEKAGQMHRNNKTIRSFVVIKASE